MVFMAQEALLGLRPEPFIPTGYLPQTSSIVAESTKIDPGIMEVGHVDVEEGGKKPNPPRENNIPDRRERGLLLLLLFSHW